MKQCEKPSLIGAFCSKVWWGNLGSNFGIISSGALTASPSTLVLCGVQQSKYGTCFWRTPNSTEAAPTGATISAVCCRTCGQVDHTMECCPCNGPICFNYQQPNHCPIQRVHCGQCGRVPTANGQQQPPGCVTTQLLHKIHFLLFAKPGEQGCEHTMIVDLANGSLFHIISQERKQ